jgi:polysaccharide pyruvyl transferase WcaK-like protein
MTETAARDRKTLTIGMLWHSPNSGNLGVGALTLGNLALARRAAAAAGFTPHFELIGFADPGRANYVSSADITVTALDGRAMLPGGALWQALDRCDAVLDIGGGDSFTDIYGAKRFGYLWLSKLAARLKGKPLVFSPQTIGPFGKVWSRPLAGFILRRADKVFARDPKSLAALEELAPDAPAALSADVAFALPYEKRDHGAGTHVGINVSGLLFNGGYSGANEFGMEIDYPAFTRKLIAALLQRPEVKVHLVPHVLSDSLPQDDDYRVAERLKQEFPRVILAERFAGPVEAKSYIAGLEMLVGGRMHACIAAHSSGVAVVPIAYSRKFAGLFEGVLGYPHLVPVTGLDTDDAIAFVLDAFERRAALAQDCLASRAKVDALLSGYVEALAQLFAGAARRRAGK